MKTGALAVLAMLVFTNTIACDVSAPEAYWCRGKGQWPIKIYTDPSFAPVEHATVLQAIDVWNSQTLAARRDKEQIFEYVGLVPDQLDETDPSDGLCVIYNVGEVTGREYWGKLTDDKPQDYAGFNVGNDAVVATFVFKENDEFEYSATVAVVATHELGHLLGLGHIEDEPAIMYPYVTLLVDADGKPILTEADLKAFCGIYDCDE